LLEGPFGLDIVVVAAVACVGVTLLVVFRAGKAGRTDTPTKPSATRASGSVAIPPPSRPMSSRGQIHGAAPGAASGSTAKPLPARSAPTLSAKGPRSRAPCPSLAKGRARHPAPFDPDSARHLAQVRVLAGRAWVTDGDTIRIGNTQIRLFGVDAPELNHPHGKNAKWALHRLCKGHTIRAEITDVDDYGRTVARCYLPDGRDLSAEMVKQGLALDWRTYSDGRYRHLEPADARSKLFLADARQKGRMHVWETFEARQGRRG
jgi:micrococcal nuclease